MSSPTPDAPVPPPHPGATPRFALPLALGAALLGAAVGGLVMYLVPKGTAVTAEAKRTQPPALVRVEQVRVGPFERTVQVLGELRADESVNLTAAEQGVVKTIHFTEGELVQAKNLLVQLDDTLEQAELAEARTEASEAKRRADEAEKLLAGGNETADEMTRLRAAQAQAEARQQVAQATVDRLRIVAPFTGTIGLRQISPGALLKPGDTVARLSRNDPLRLTSTVSELSVGALRKGLGLVCQTPALPGKTFTGSLDFVAPTLDTATRSVQVQATLANREGLLRPGMTLNAEITLETVPQAITVPEAAIELRGSRVRAFVVVKKDGSQVAEQRSLHLGWRSKGRIEVVDGLRDGDLLVIEGVQKISRSGAAVEVLGTTDAAAPAATKAAQAGTPATGPGG